MFTRETPKTKRTTRSKSNRANNPVNTEDFVDNSQEKGTFRQKNKLKQMENVKIKKIKFTIDKIENNVIIEM